METDPEINDGNFRALLRHQAESGDIVLREHLEKCPGNASYLSPEIQNELILQCSNIIRVCFSTL